MKKQPRTKIKDLSQFRQIDNSEQRQLVGGFARATAYGPAVDRSISRGRLVSTASLTPLRDFGGFEAGVSTCTDCGDCDCD